MGAMAFNKILMFNIAFSCVSSVGQKGFQINSKAERAKIANDTVSRKLLEIMHHFSVKYYFQVIFYHNLFSLHIVYFSFYSLHVHAPWN